MNISLGSSIPVISRWGGGQHKLFGKSGYVLKADIRHYFDTVDHEILLRIIGRKIKDPDVMWLINTILKNHKTETEGKGMPIGNLTSQFFANVYLNELDYFVKHKLKAKYYIRYVDDFAILHTDLDTLENWKEEIDKFLRYELKLKLHPDKSRIMVFDAGVTMLGFRIFCNYRLLKKSNTRIIWKRLDILKQKHYKGEITTERVNDSIKGWYAYAAFANTYKFRKKVALRLKELLADQNN